ncbi:hypothetical protein K492DRAFT_240794 [Lichtheimia hyalospora FSU 10163]|nr:hypothetical protein K492DRAFT_240794 [Lichtheimia hyalospora FSU 10163]
MSRVDARYICQSAANAIISEIGPYRVSTDALQAINHFLDEYLVLLLMSSLSLDLSRIKAVVFTLLPSTLGKNAIVEAELEVKTFTETEAIDYESYERMRMLGTDGQPEFPVNDALPLLREKCLEFCTLADREEQRAYMDPAITPTARQNIAIVPIVAIYVTTVLEHIAEYVLTAIAMTAEHEDTEYIRIKQVFLALVDDVQVGGVFHRMELRDKLEKRAFAMGYKPRTPVPSFHAAPHNHMRSSTSGSNNNNGADGFLDICFDDLDIGYDDDGMNPNDRLSVSQYSMKSGVSQRPTSMMSGSTSNGTLSTFDNSSANSSKKAYKVFRKDDGGADRSPLSVSVYDPDAPAMNFEDLIRSGNTMKVSLTPNRLKSIEVKNQMVDDTPKSSNWERRSTASSASRATRSLNATTATSSSAPRRNISSMSAVPNSSKPKHVAPTPAIHHHTVKPKSSFGSDRSIKKPAAAPMPPLPEQKKPAGPPDTRFENPREAPKPPTITTTTTTTNNSASPSSSASSVIVQSPTPISSTPKPTPEKSTNDTSSVKKEQQPQPQRPRLLRRSSSSSKKSRENLRRQREKEEQEEQRKKAEAALRGLPKPTTTDSVDNESQEQQHKEKASLSSKSSNESVGQSITSSNNDAVPPSPPASEGSNKDQEKGVHFDNERSTHVDEPERPSSMTAKRASLVGSSRRQSLHESYAMNDIMRHRLSTAGSVEMTVKAFDSMSKSSIPDASNTTTTTTITTATTTSPTTAPTTNNATTGRRSPVTMARRTATVEQGNSTHSNNNNSHGDEEVSTTPAPAIRAPRPSSVLDKVMQFERANSLDDSAQQHHRQHRTASYMPRRERFLYLQREPGLLERRSTTYTTTANTRPITVDAGVQTDPVLVTNHDENDGPPALVITDETGVSISKSIHTEDVSDSENLSDKSSERGLVEGDEEWFLQDDEWDDVQDQENAVVEWLLGEA